MGPKVTAIQRPEMPELRLQAMSAQIGHVIAVGHEADILAVMLVGIEKAVGLGDFSRFRLFIGS